MNKARFTTAEWAQILREFIYDEEEDAPTRALSDLQVIRKFNEDAPFVSAALNKLIDLSAPKGLTDAQYGDDFPFSKEALKLGVETSSIPKRGIRVVMQTAVEIAKKSPELIKEFVKSGSIDQTLFDTISNMGDKVKDVYGPDYDPKGFVDNVVSIAADLLDPRFLGIGEGLNVVGKGALKGTSYLSSRLAGTPQVIASKVAEKSVEEAGAIPKLIGKALKGSAEGSFLGGVQDSGELSGKDAETGAIIGGVVSPIIGVPGKLTKTLITKLSGKPQELLDIVSKNPEVMKKYENFLGKVNVSDEYNNTLKEGIKKELNNADTNSLLENVLKKEEKEFIDLLNGSNNSIKTAINIIKNLIENPEKGSKLYSTEAVISAVQKKIKEDPKFIQKISEFMPGLSVGRIASFFLNRIPINLAARISSKLSNLTSPLTKDIPGISETGLTTELLNQTGLKKPVEFLTDKIKERNKE